MTPEIYKAVAELHAANPLGPTAKILEVGSMDVNGSVRPIFTSGPQPALVYLGIDQLPGKGVDQVASPLELASRGARECYDAIICLEVLEHDPRFYLTLRAMYTLLKQGGLLYLSTPTYGFPYHGFPKDYYRFSSDAFREVLLEGYQILDLRKLKDPNGDPTLLALGRKV